MKIVKKMIVDSALESVYQDHPVVLLDVGASGGIHGRWGVISDVLRVIGIEPDEDSYSKLVRETKAAGDSQNIFLNTGLHDHAASVPVYLTRKQGCSSLFRPDMELIRAFHDADRFSVERVGEMTVERLDVVLEKAGVSDVDFVKVDTQGSELDILKGAGNYLAAGIIGAEIEVEFIPLYQGQPLFAEVDIFMRDQGFQIFDLARHNWRRTDVTGSAGCYRGQLVFADALYLISLQGMQEILSQYENESERSGKFLRAISVVLLYGYYDYALFLCHEIRGVEDALKERIEHIVRASIKAQWVLPEVRGKTRLGNIFCKLSSWVSESRVNYDDPKLGN